MNGAAIAHPQSNGAALGRLSTLLVLRGLLPLAAAYLGAVLMALGAQELGPLALVWPMFLLACALSWVIGGGRRLTTWTGAAMFGVCLLIAGISHVYQTAMFGSVLNTTPDVFFWHELSKNGFDYALPPVNAPYAVNVWRAMYAVARRLQLGNGAWIGIMVNAAVVSILAVLTVRAVIMVFSEDRRRAKLAARLVLSCGIFWLFGSMLVRDAFAVLVQLIVFITIVHLLAGRVTVPRLLTHAPPLAIATLLTYGIRQEMLATYPVIGALAALAWGLQGRGLRRLGLLVVAAVAAAMVVALNFTWFANTIEVAQYSYGVVIADHDAGTSGLGYRLVVSQPLPIRVLTGLLYMHVFPIPLWYGFSFSLWDYYWLKSFAAIFVVAITPLAVLGFWRIMRAALVGAKHLASLVFIALYWPAMVAAVAVTSLESRHVGQFMPALIVLAVVPDLSQRADRLAFRGIALVWYGGVVLVHAAWLLMRAF